MSDNTDAARRPITKFSQDAMTAAVFADERTTKEGEKFTAYSVQLSRVFKREQTGDFDYTTSIDEKNLDKAVKVLTDAAHWVASQKHKAAA